MKHEASLYLTSVALISKHGPPSPPMTKPYTHRHTLFSLENFFFLTVCGDIASYNTISTFITLHKY